MLFLSPNQQFQSTDAMPNGKPSIERAQALTDIFRSALCCHCNETCALMANPPNSAQLEGTPYHFRKLHPSPCSSVGMWRGTDGRTYRRLWPIYISPQLRLVRNVIIQWTSFFLYPSNEFWMKTCWLPKTGVIMIILMSFVSIYRSYSLLCFYNIYKKASMSWQDSVPRISGGT